MQPPTAYQTELATSYLSIGVVAALALTVIVTLVGLAVLRARLARRTRELEVERARRLRAEAELKAELETRRDRFEERVRERTHALESRNEQLSRLRVTLEAANRRLKRLVGVDALTGIANRRQFDRVLDREVRRARREQRLLSLIFLDIDEFKQFNDAHGHALGDEVLRRVARTLDESFRRGGDLVARYGGEEFAVILPGVDARRAGLYAERLRRRIWRMAISTGAANGRITVSGGVATLTSGLPGGLDTTPDALLRAADQALYRAKRQGRNRIATAGSLDTATDRPRIELAS